MRVNRIHIIFLISFMHSVVLAQFQFDAMHYRNRIANSSHYMLDDLDIHSSVFPQMIVREDPAYMPENGQLITYNKTRGNETAFGFRLYPLSDIGVGIESGVSQNELLKYTAGIGLAADFSSKKWYATAKLLPYFTQPSFTADSIFQLSHTDLGTTRPITGNLLHRNEILIGYQPVHFFTFIGGYGKNFFGEGYRSLLLSDNASNYPFFKIETKFGSIKYVNLYAVWNDNALAPKNKSLDQMKFSSTHYLSWNITREFNLSIFETVVWQLNDTLVNRGFDVNYLNPVVFYRPVEYSNGSADNVLLGLNLSYKINKYHCIYSQVIIDEFLLSEIKSGDKWWGNKWGAQLGYKTNRFFAEDLYMQTEFNVVRPFTYAHKYSVQSYGHLNASVTHPLGANFYELTNILSYQQNSIRFTNKMTFASYGADIDSLNFGQNIFNSYSDRVSDYNNLIMQGNRTNVFNEELIVEKPLFEKINLYLYATYNYRMQWTQTNLQHNHFFLIGLKSRIWNAYGDI